VPKNTARIRISLNCLHEEKDIVRLLDLVAEFVENNKVKNLGITEPGVATNGARSVSDWL